VAVGQLLAGAGHRATRHDSATRAPGAGRIGRLCSIAVDQLYSVMRDAEHRVGDLRQRRLQSLAVAVSANSELEPAIRGEARLALLAAWHERNSPSGIDTRSVAGLFRIHCDADAEKPPVWFATLLPFAQRTEPDRIDGLPQGLGIVAGIEVPLGDVVERHLLGTH
jgi:hypothetical protein